MPVSHTGPGTQPTGAVTGNTASLLTYPRRMRYVQFSNANAAVLYIKVNDAATPTVSPTNFDFAMSQGQFPMTIEGAVAIENIAVYIAATGISIGAVNASAAAW